jgi:formamidopyrimidine-DNA glycosylase
VFELPELITLSRQINQSMRGRTVARGTIGHTPHRFVRYNRTREEFASLARGKSVGRSHCRGTWLFVPLDPGFVLALGDCGGQVLFQEAGIAAPSRHHLLLSFQDGSRFVVATRSRGELELHAKGQERNRQNIRDMRRTPMDPEFTFEYFSALVADLAGGEPRSVKGLLTQDQLIPGLGSALAQDILFAARLDPRHTLEDLGRGQKKRMYSAIMTTVGRAVRRGGRSDELDLFGRPGGYERVLGGRARQRVCPGCGAALQSIRSPGSVCTFCPVCQT